VTRWLQSATTRNFCAAKLEFPLAKSADEFLGRATSRRHVRAGTYVLRRAYSKNKFSDGNAGTGQ
jgi:hypothetical protein